MRSQPGQQRPLKMLEWDEKQCELIREIHLRHDELGESFPSIARDFAKRGVKNQRGEPWASISRTTGKLVDKRVVRAYRWYSDFLAQGQDLGDMEG